MFNDIIYSFYSYCRLHSTSYVLTGKFSQSILIKGADLISFHLSLILKFLISSTFVCYEFIWYSQGKTYLVDLVNKAKVTCFSALRGVNVVFVCRQTQKNPCMLILCPLPCLENTDEARLMTHPSFQMFTRYFVIRSDFHFHNNQSRKIFCSSIDPEPEYRLSLLPNRVLWNSHHSRYSSTVVWFRSLHVLGLVLKFLAVSHARP